MDKAGRRSTKLLLDIVLILAVLAIGAAILLLTHNNREQGAYVVVMVQNRDEARFSLAEDGFYAINGGTNTIEISDCRVRMLEADCPNHLCMHQGWIRFEGQSIVCLPNKVTVIVRGTGDGFDFVH